MELVTKEYLEDNIKTYDTYRGLDKIGSANGIATLDANGKVPIAQIPSGITNNVTYNNNLVTSLVAGTNTSMSISNGALTINSTAATRTDITNAINALDVSDSAVSGKYVSAVSETNGKITVTRANFPANSLPSYTTSDSGKVLKVNSNGNGVEWGDAPSSGAEQAISSVKGRGANEVNYTVSLLRSNTKWTKALVEVISGSSTITAGIKSFTQKSGTTDYYLNLIFKGNGIIKVTPLASTNNASGKSVIIQVTNYKAGDVDPATATMDYWYL